MVSIEFSEGISETLDILEYMDTEYKSKIPKKFMDFLEKNKSVTYVSKVDYSKKLNEMNLKEKTKDILATIYMNYWCNSEQKLNYRNLLKLNEEKYQEELKEKYDFHNLFKNKTSTIIKQNQPVQQDVALVEVEEKFFTKFIQYIKNIFHIK